MSFFQTLFGTTKQPTIVPPQTLETTKSVETQQPSKTPYALRELTPDEEYTLNVTKAEQFVLTLLKENNCVPKYAVITAINESRRNCTLNCIDDPSSKTTRYLYSKTDLAHWVDAFYLNGKGKQPKTSLSKR